MGDFGIKIAKSGKSIISTDPNDYHFWTKFQARSIKLRTYLSLTSSSAINPSPVTATLTHNFGYVPEIKVFTSSYNGQYVEVPSFTTSQFGKSGDLQEEILDAVVTSTTITVSAVHEWFTPMSGFSTGIATAYTFDILLFMEPIPT